MSSNDAARPLSPVETVLAQNEASTNDLRVSKVVLRLRRCPRCDYDLAGLPRRHRCPECGFEYDHSMFTVYGWERKERLSLAGRLMIGAWWERILALALLLVLASAVGFEAYSIWKTGKPRSVFLIVVLIMVIVQAIRMMPHVRRTQGTQRGTVQMFFTPDGASIRRGPGEARLIPWNRFRRLRFRKLRYHKVGRDSWHLRLIVPFWQLKWRHDVEAVIECTPREAALVRGEIRRRWRATCAAAKRERNV